MYYLELIQRFWHFNKENQVGSTAISMYLYLLKTSNDTNRYDFNISDVEISKQLGLTRKTVKCTKEKLRSLGLIQYQTKNGSPGSYRLILDYPLLITHTKVSEKRVKERKNISQKTEQLEIPLQAGLPIQDTSESIPKIVNEKITPQFSKVLSPIIDDKSIPTIEEFIEYAQTLESYDSQLDFNIKEKYENWVNNNWKNSSDRPITNWKSSLKSTLPFMKNNTINTIQSIPNIKRSKFSIDN
ncbi:hypothetical protein Q73A0000_07145 [Kaistella flava (ex Peng et al. 2021)]|uniref:Helix-turn-helix domain-containing protein n=1 Tax=Kaistella flava (ex Peng et al. 2021) TaxID=2038776 RepID=A0A7M2Y9R1_9FLAO|nr:hypothetical protein [Kaistella flava (ex Peng et al. 2021)]QOW10152.1 hypothetical protein Q73A0000_07145 [Kaistella flava (ex Peng et al. 2021)]